MSCIEMGFNRRNLGHLPPFLFESMQKGQVMSHLVLNGHDPYRIAKQPKGTRRFTALSIHSIPMTYNLNCGSDFKKFPIKEGHLI